MELVYLWVEKYKNIKNQGFNFSPRFEFKFHDENLTIKEKKCTSIFPKNINITAIVGENGSGKSSISELLVKFSYEEFHDMKTFLVYFDGKSFLFKQSFTDNILNFMVTNNTKYAYDKKNQARIISVIYFSNDVASIFNNPIFSNRQRYANLDAYYNSNTQLMENNKYPHKVREEKNKLETFNTRFKLLLEKEKDFLININKNLIFDSFRRELHFYELGAYFAINGDKDFLTLLDVPELKGTLVFPSSTDKNEILYKFLILFRLNQLEVDKRSKVIAEIKTNFNKKTYNLELCLKILSSFNTFDKNEQLYSKENIQDIFDKYEYSKDEIWIEKKTCSVRDNFETSNELLNIIFKSGITRIDFFNNLSPDYNYFSLSSGEREYIKTFVTLIHHLQKTNLKKFIFIFDEIELGLHPKWQKMLIHNFVNIVSKYIKGSMNFIFTSHSPFILSDLPKENVLFLKDGKQIDALDKKQTFGANIHTLLSDGFFMSDGLMGEFAKGKIEEIKKFYEFVQKFKQRIDTHKKVKERIKKYYLNRKEKFEHIQSIIGEPFLQTIIKNYLDELYLIFSDDNTLINKELEKLEKRQVYLKSLKK